MIERAARCLDLGGQIVRREAKKALRSQRCLHSSFWSHGAGDINLPAWWVFFLQEAGSKNETRSRTGPASPGKKVSGALQDIFLDFLYPVQTLAHIRRLKRSTLAHQHATQSAKFSCRTYTSIAEDVITGTEAVQAGADADAEPKARAEPEAPATPVSAMTAANIRASISKILDKEAPKNFRDQLWERYRALLDTSETLSSYELIRMLRCLVKSSQTVDMKRVVTLFESIPCAQRRAIHYKYAVSAAITREDLGRALRIHREALSRVSGSIGTSTILAFTVKHEMWTAAIKIWHSFWVKRFAYYKTSDLWAEIDAWPLSRLFERAISAVNFALKVRKKIRYEPRGAERDFALELIRRYFKVTRGTAFNVGNHREILKNVRMLDPSNIEIPTLALDQFLSSDNPMHQRRGLNLYRILRNEVQFSPGRDLLVTISQRLIAEKNLRGMFMIIDDWRKYHQILPASLAIDIARVLSANGELNSLQRLFHDFCSDHGAPKETSQLYHSLLYVYNRRADVEGIVRTWSELQENYDFKPGTRAWNHVILTFARVGDVEAAAVWFQRMRDDGVKPDHHTFFGLISMYGKRGDRDAVVDLFQLSKAEGIEPSALMIDTIVMVNINNDRLLEAEELVEAAVHMKMEGSRTFMWNILLNAYALRKALDKVSELHRKMQEAEIPADSMTYAALLSALSIAKFPDMALKVLRKTMPQVKVGPTALHYAIVMSGYLATKEYDKIFQLYKTMLRNNFTPTMATENLLLRAAAAVDKGGKWPLRKPRPEEPTVLVRAETAIEQTLANLDPKELAASEPRMFIGSEHINEAFSSSYFEYLIYVYGKETAFQKVSEFYDRYIQTASQHINRDIEASPPMRILTALMASHLRAGNYDDIDRCWDLCLDKASQLARRSASAGTSEPNWVLHSRRFIVNIPLDKYIEALVQQGRIDALIFTVDSLKLAGYALNSPNWNAYTRALVTSVSLTHQTLAFRVCEKELMPAWEGWTRFGDPQWMSTKFKHLIRRTLLVRQKVFPHYVTLVYLARCYLLAKKRSRWGEHSMMGLEEVAPKTVDAILNMPRLEDEPQTTILRPGET